METSTLTDDMDDIDMLLAGRATPVVLDCYAPGCVLCAALGGALDELVRDLQGQLVVEKIDVSARPQVARRFDVRAVPTLVLFKKGELKATRVGAASRTCRSPALPTRPSTISPQGTSRRAWEMAIRIFCRTRIFAPPTDTSLSPSVMTHSSRPGFDLPTGDYIGR